jgi:hypothetical protein
MNALEKANHQVIIHNKYLALKDTFNQRTRRLWAATEALALGNGGITVVQKATGIGWRAIHHGIQELTKPDENILPLPKIRRPGAGRKRLIQTDATLLEDLKEIINPATRGDPESPLCWCSKSLHQIKGALVEKGHCISHQSVGTLLVEIGYSLQSNKKNKEGASHPDRDGQFRYINERTLTLQARNQPVISVDCKKKESVGNFKNGGREWHKKGEPEEVLVHDFIHQGSGKAIPYGVYDVSKNVGFVNVGVDHDTAAFAVTSIRTWWDRLGKVAYPEASELQIMADGGGSNSSRSRLWKVCLQEFSDASGLRIHVCHFPPRTSKWNKIEHRLFSFISMNWRGRPLVSHEVIVSLIGSVRTSSGLHVDAVLDLGIYPTKLVVSDALLSSVRLERHAYHGEWNYTIEPR